MEQLMQAFFDLSSTLRIFIYGYVIVTISAASIVRMPPRPHLDTYENGIYIEKVRHRFLLMVYGLTLIVFSASYKATSLMGLDTMVLSLIVRQ